MERGRVLVVVGTLLDEIRLHLAAGNVGIVDVYAAVGALVVDLILFEKLQRLHPEAFVEARVACVDIVVVGFDLPPQHELEQIGEQVHLGALWLYGVVEASVGVLCEVDLAVYIASPNHVLLHLRLCGESDLGAGRELVFVGFAFLLRSLFGATLCRLGESTLDGNQGKDDN